MAVQLILKNSSVEDKKPTPSQLTNGEISLNYSSAGAFLCCTDTDGNTQQVGGVKIDETAPDAPVKQSLWFRPSTLTLSVYDGDKWLPIEGGGGGGGGGSVISVNSQTGIVVLTAADVGAASEAQGDLADTALQPGDNISELNNNAGYITEAELPVLSVNGKTGVVVLDATDVGALAPGDNVSELVNDAEYISKGDNVSDLANDAGYITLGEVPTPDLTPYVEKAGDTMTGQLTLPGGGGATQALQKQEIEGLISAISTPDLTPYVEKAGDNMTGDLTLGNGTDNDRITLGATTGKITTDDLESGAATIDAGTQIPSRLWIKNNGNVGSASDAHIDFGNSQGRGGIAYSDVSNNSMSFTVGGKQAVRLKANDPTTSSGDIECNFNGDVKIVGDIQSTSQNGGQLAGFRNVLVNGNLTFNQRGVDIATAATGSYGQDRWKKTAGGMTQIVEEGNFDPGATYTLSGTGVTTQQLTAPITGNWTLPDIPVTARKIQLEPGPVATPFEHRPIGTELALCQRYYQKISYGPRDSPYVFLIFTATQAVSGPLSMICPMRVAPSGQVLNADTWQVVDNGTPHIITSRTVRIDYTAGVENLSTVNLNFFVDAATPMTPWDVVWWRSNHNSSALMPYIALDAEL